MCIVLFDIDGTLTQSGKKVTSDVINVLKKLKEINNIKLGLVGGGTIEKIKYQMFEILDLFTYIFAESGAIVNVNNVTVLERNMLDYCDLQLLNKLKEKAIELISRVPNIPTDTKKIDVRTGLLYISIPGIDATDEQRNDFIMLNNKLNIKEHVLNELKLIDCLNKFEILYGGQVGISVSPKGFNKSMAMDFLIKNKLSEQVYYFGDKTDLNGNDYHIYNHELVTGIKVIDPTHTIKKINEIFLKE